MRLPDWVPGRERRQRRATARQAALERTQARQLAALMAILDGLTAPRSVTPQPKQEDK